jgi:hypothetical protein
MFPRPPISRAVKALASDFGSSSVDSGAKAATATRGRASADGRGQKSSPAIAATAMKSANPTDNLTCKPALRRGALSPAIPATVIAAASDWENDGSAAKRVGSVSATAGYAASLVPRAGCRSNAGSRIGRDRQFLAQNFAELIVLPKRLAAPASLSKSPDEQAMGILAQATKDHEALAGRNRRSELSSAQLQVREAGQHADRNIQNAGFLDPQPFLKSLSRGGQFLEKRTFIRSAASASSSASPDFARRSNSRRSTRAPWSERFSGLLGHAAASDCRIDTSP